MFLSRVVVFLFFCVYDCNMFCFVSMYAHLYINKYAFKQHILNNCHAFLDFFCLCHYIHVYFLQKHCMFMQKTFESMICEVKTTEYVVL